MLVAQKCSAVCEDLAAWQARTAQLVAAIDAGRHGGGAGGGGRAAARRKRFSQLCDPPTCTFLERASRVRTLGLLGSMGYSGASAEVGVWQGQMSHTILKSFARGGVHLSVDPWVGHMGGCEALQDRHCALRKLRNGTMVRRANPRKFDEMYESVRDKLTTAFPGRSVIVRNFSVEASRMVPDAALDFVYIDGRHDFAGVTEDLVSWWPKLCPGGLLGGHDWIGNGDASGAVKRWSEGLGATEPRQPAHIYVTADHPASYFMFKAPKPCAAQ